MPFAIGGAALVVIIGAAVVLAIGVFGNGSSSSKEATNAAGNQASVTATAPSDSSSTTEAADESTGESASGSEQQTQAQSQSGAEPQTSAQSQSSTLVDLSNPTDYYDLNIFLSNFSEWPEFWEHSTFNRSTANNEKLVNWGFWHVVLNDSSALESGSFTPSGAPASSGSKEIEKGDPKMYPRRVETSRIQTAISRFIGSDLNLSGYNSGNGSYFEQGGYMYEGLYRGSVQVSDGTVLATDVSDAGNGTVNVKFTLYIAGTEFNEAVSDKSWYGMSDSELRAAMSGAQGRKVTTHPGTATVEVIGTGGDRAFKLVSFAVNQ